MKLHLLSLFLGCFLFPLSAGGWEGQPKASARDAGFSEERLQELDAAMQKHIDDNQLAGLQTLIARGGKIIHFANLGKQDLESGKAMGANTIFRIYSMTKPITATAVMILQEQGKLKIDDPVARYLPKFGNLKVYVAGKNGAAEGQALDRPMTIEHLLTHTAGLTYGLFGNTAVDKRYRKDEVFGAGNLSEMVDRLAEIPLLYQPGEQWHYSVANDVLGRIVEIASGQNFDLFLKQHIFEPLHMTDTGFYVPEHKRDRFASLYLPGKAGLERVTDENTRFENKPDILSGGGGLVSTTGDYFRFCSMLLNGGVLDGNRLLKAETVALMSGNRLSESALSKFRIKGYGYGLGFSVVLDKEKSPATDVNGLFRWGGLANTTFWIDPQNSLICILMTQRFPARYPIGKEFQELVYGAMTN